MSRESLRLPAPVRGARLLAHGAGAVEEHRLADARRAGEHEGRAAASAVFEAAVAALEEREATLVASLSRGSIELALEIARALLRTELREGHYELEKIVRETLGESGVGRNPCVVHLNPADHARLADVRFRSGTRLEPDEGVPRGDVHVETPLGLFVRSMDRALEAIAQRLREELA